MVPVALLLLDESRQRRRTAVRFQQVWARLSFE
jgi:hypothetical protein